MLRILMVTSRKCSNSKSNWFSFVPGLSWNQKIEISRGTIYDSFFYQLFIKVSSNNSARGSRVSINQGDTLHCHRKQRDFFPCHACVDSC